MLMRVIIGVFVLGLISSCDQGDLIVDSSNTAIEGAAGWGFDSFRRDRSVALRWNIVDHAFMPSPEPVRPVPIASVRLFMSEEGPDQGYRPVVQEHKKRKDSVLVGRLTNGKLYYFQLVGYDSSGKMTNTSRPLLTMPGRVDEIIASFSANQFEDPKWISNLDWSHTARRLAYVASMSNQLSPDIFVLDLDTRENWRLTRYGSSNSNHRLLGVSWSPEGNAQAYCYTPSRTFAEIDYAIWVISINGDQPRRITRGRVDFDPLWTKNNEIIFCRGTYEPPNIPEIWKVNLTSGDEVRLTSDQAYRKYNPTISPDGRRLAFRGQALSGGAPSVYLFHSDGTYSKVVENKYWEDIQPSWSPDGKKIFFSSDRSGHFEIWSVEVEAGLLRQVTGAAEPGVHRYYPKVSSLSGELATIQVYGDRAKLIVLSPQ